MDNTIQQSETLVKLLNTRYKIAKSFTKKFHDEIKKCISDYEAGKSKHDDGVYNKHVDTKSRYDITIPYIFATHESMMASFFDNMPDIVVTGRTKAANKTEMIKAIYEYLKDVADLDEFLGVSSWWFFLVGMVEATVEHKQKISSYAPQLDSTGQPMMDEMGQPVEVPIYEYNDPAVTVENLLKINFSPESEFSIDGKKIPYYFMERLVDVDEIQSEYSKKVEADETIEVEDLSEDKDDIKTDLKRAKVMYYFGKLPSTVAEDMKKYNLDWSYDADYKVFLTKDTILLAEPIEEKPCKFARLYSVMSKFFGFGIGKTLRPFQKDMSIRRQQQLAYADRFAFPWLMVPGETKVDQKSLMDYQKLTPLTFSSEQGKPEYLNPPPMPDSINNADQAIRQDAQFVSGTLDLSKGAQQTNTVKTATGQQLFAQSQDKRLNKARKSLAKYYREVVIKMFKSARDNWEDHKTITFTDEEGNDVEMVIDKTMLDEIDFDTDIDFNLDSVSVNQDIMSQRWLSLLDTSLTVPCARVDKVWQKTLKDSFKIDNPEVYTKTPEEIVSEQGGMMPTADPSVPPIDNPENVPGPQTTGEQLAPQPPYAG